MFSMMVGQPRQQCDQYQQLTLQASGPICGGGGPCFACDGSVNSIKVNEHALIKIAAQFTHSWPWREAGDVLFPPLSGISGLSFDSSFLSSLSFFCLVLLLLLSCHFSANS